MTGSNRILHREGRLEFCLFSKKTDGDVVKVTPKHLPLLELLLQSVV